MTDSTKKLIGALFATAQALVVAAVSMNMVAPAHHALALYIVAAFGIVGTTLLPQVIGQSVPPPAKIGMLLPVAFVGIALAFGACDPAARAAFTLTFEKCAANSVPSVLGGLVGDAEQALLAGADTATLKALGKKDGITLGVDTLNCVIEAAVAALDTKAHAALQGGHGEIDPHYVAAIARGKAFLAANR